VAKNRPAARSPLTRAAPASEFQLAIEAVPVAMLMIDRAGALVLVNGLAEQLFGYARAELVGRPVEVLVPERFRSRHPEHRVGFFATPSPRAMGAGRDLFALRKDGREVPVEIGLSPVATAAGQFVLASVVDISERRRAEEAKDQLLRAVAETSQNVASAASEILVVTTQQASGAQQQAASVAETVTTGLFLATADILADAGERLRARREPSGASLDALLSRLQAASTAAPAPSPRSATPATLPPVPPPGPAAAGPPRDGIVRVPAGKLDRLLAWSGELLVARRRAASRPEDVTLLREQLAEIRREWRRLERPLGAVLAASGRSRTSPAAGGRALSRRSLLAIDRTRGGLRKLERGLESLEARLAEDHHELERAASPLDQEIRRVRMLPFGEACDGLGRLVRDLARAGGKDVALAVEGADVQLDPSILEGLRDPLVHLVRNAVDHGLEPVAERTGRGKPPGGRVTVRAALLGDGVEVLVADDGRGLDLRAIRERARQRGLAMPDDDGAAGPAQAVRSRRPAPADRAGPGARRRRRGRRARIHGALLIARAHGGLPGEPPCRAAGAG
jgi:PAS domain S-box-containing protein